MKTVARGTAHNRTNTRRKSITRRRTLNFTFVGPLVREDSAAEIAETDRSRAAPGHDNRRESETTRKRVVTIFTNNKNAFVRSLASHQQLSVRGNEPTKSVVDRRSSRLRLVPHNLQCR